MSAHNVFGGAHFDRLGDRRRDREWLRAQLSAPDTMLVPVWNDRSLLASGDLPDAVLVPLDAVPSPDPDDVILLGEFQGRVCLALDVGQGKARAPLESWGEFRSLRTVGLLVAADRAALLAYAQAMVLWHRRQRHCGRCGALTRSSEAGHLRRCIDEACQQGFFPRIDPAIIVLVEHRGKALLGRQSGWPAGVYSSIAGFVEPGESLEDAVRREVAEETGIEVGPVTYRGSQPWPFPSSLMLGFRAEAVSTRIRLHDEELEDAGWFSREELQMRYRSGSFRIPPRLSISHRLIAEWFDSGQPGRLAAMLETGD